MTMIASIHATILPARLPIVLDPAINGSAFSSWVPIVQQILCPAIAYRKSRDRV
jgi:hypothetical protein